MSKKNVKILYDRKSGVLSVEVGHGKSVDSDIQGNMVLDYDKKGNVVRINLYDFSFDAFRENQKAIKNFARRIKVPVLAR